MAVVSELVAGRELDALVAERVMDWHIVEDSRGGTEWWCDPAGNRMARVDGLSEEWLVWNPSEDIESAWQVVEHFDAERWLWGILRQKRADRFFYSVSLSEVDDDGHIVSERGRVEADTAPLAICRAALAAC